jgi:hypothetical protein
VHSHSDAWTAASRTEFIRQVAVHWRAFIDATFGMTCASELIMSLTDCEIGVLAQVLQLDKEIKAIKEGVVFCMGQELNAKFQHLRMLRARQCDSYMHALQTRMS